MLELQSKYAQFVPDDWGGRMEKGYRDLGVIGFNVLEGSVLDIQELHRTVTFLAWAEPKLHALHWERLLLRAVVDFGRYCGARQIRIQPATFLSADSSTQADAARQAEQREACRQLAEASVPAARFDYDPGLDRLVLNLESN
jgi:hypothetical protein